MQQSLLKILGSRAAGSDEPVAAVGSPGCRSGRPGSILFIAAGTFADLFERERPSSRIGFGDSAQVSLRKELSTDLLGYGMLSELLGRLPVRVQLQPLSEDELCQILAGPQDALLGEYQTLLALDNVQVDFSDSALRRLPGRRCGRAGARSLRGLAEQGLSRSAV